MSTRARSRRVLLDDGEHFVGVAKRQQVVGVDDHHVDRRPDGGEDLLRRALLIASPGHDRGPHRRVAQRGGERVVHQQRPQRGAVGGPGTPITLTFWQPVARALGSLRPPVTPITPGTWHTVNGHTIVFQPEGFGYGLGATVKLGLAGSVRLVGGPGDDACASWSVPAGATLRLQQLLALLGYLPVSFNYRDETRSP